MNIETKTGADIATDACAASASWREQLVPGYDLLPGLSIEGSAHRGEDPLPRAHSVLQWMQSCILTRPHEYEKKGVRIMPTRLRMFVALAIVSTLFGCIDPSKSPYVSVHDLVTNTDELQASAEQGSAEDRYRLGLRYERLLLDYGEAVRWYRMAAIQQHSEAIYRLCLLSDSGRGMPQDYQEALRWCRLAADHGHARAMFTIGTYFETGRGVPQDSVQAHQWYNLSAANGYEEGVARRDRLALNMTSTQIAQAQFQARSWRGKYQDSSQRMSLDQPLQLQ